VDYQKQTVKWNGSTGSAMMTDIMFGALSLMLMILVVFVDEVIMANYKRGGD